MGDQTARKSPIGSGQQDVGHSGVATGRGVLNLSSSISMGDEENPTDGVSLYLIICRYFYKGNVRRIHIFMLKSGFKDCLKRYSMIFYIDGHKKQ